jgi:hypothetical protein
MAGGKKRGFGRPRIPVPLTQEQADKLTTVRGLKQKIADADQARKRGMGNTPIVRHPETGETLGFDLPMPVPVTTQDRTVRVASLNAFFESLPPESVTHFSKVYDRPFNQGWPTNTNFEVLKTRVGQEQVWCLTDVFYYAVSPGSGMNAAPIELDAPSLTGLFSFDLLFNGRSPMVTAVQTYSPYISRSERLDINFGVTGYPFLEREFGAQRASGFALYAKANEKITVRARILDEPQFPITKIGAQIHGFTVPASLFDRVILK